MSTSKGVGVSTEEIAEFLPADILRFLMVRTKAKRAIEFDPEGDTIPLLYDEYDRCAKEFAEDSESDLKRAYHFSEIDTKKSQPKYLLRFSKVANFLQMPRADIFSYARDEKGSDLTETEKKEIEFRIEVAKKWLEKFAPESVKFQIQENLPEVAKSLTDEQKSFLAAIAEVVSKKEKWTGEELHKEIHDIKNESGINPRDAFMAIYKTFLGKDSGPQAGWLLASLDHNFVIDRLKEV
jgi:lysyl-tRNA synthetase class 1